MTAIDKFIDAAFLIADAGQILSTFPA